MTEPSSSELEPILEGMRKGQTLEQFRAEWGSLPSGFYEKCGEMIDRVVRFLQHNTPISVDKTLKGGSLGKNIFTSANTDVDLFVFVNELASIDDMKRNTIGILNIIKAKLDSASWHSGPIEFQRARMTHSIRFQPAFSDMDVQITMDLFPIFDVLRNKTLADVYSEMKRCSPEDWEYYSVCLAPKQVEFIKQAPSKLQDLMKLLKHYAKTEIGVDHKSSTSYFIEVLVMYTWHKARKPYDFNMSEWFEDILGQMADLPSLYIVWEHLYTASRYRSLPPAPLVLDPVNPFNNVVPQGELRDHIMKQARKVLKRIKKLKSYLKSGPPPILQDMRRGQTLQQFVAETIQPDSDFRRNCDEVVERVTFFLQHKTEFSVNMVIKGGSLGKSTNVLGKSDVDLVVFINSLRTVKDLENNMRYILTTLKEALASQWSSFAGALELVRETPYGLQYRLSCSESGHKHDVDILPACYVLKDKTAEEVYQEMARSSLQEREYYSVCFAQNQVEFVKQAPIKAKNLIRLVKYWAKTELNVEKKIVTSYFLECLVMYNWIEWGRPEDFNTNDRFKEIMTQLANISNMRILWPRRYTASTYFNVDQMYPRGTSVLLDPNNPFRNLTPFAKNLSFVMERANRVLQKIEDLNRYRSGKFLDS